MPDDQRRDLAIANRILARHGVVDAFGHVSVRAAGDPARFLLARNKAPATVTAADILVFDRDGAPVVADGTPVYLERFIHAEIYKARPDVMAVVHSHADAVIPFGAARGTALRPIWHMAGFLAEGVPVYEIRDHAGDASNMLIVDGALGASLAAVLGDNAAVLMRGHGATVVGASLPEAVFRAVYLQRNAEIQLKATPLGDLTFLNAAEAGNADAANRGQVARAWSAWSGEVGEM